MQEAKLAAFLTAAALASIPGVTASGDAGAQEVSGQIDLGRSVQGRTITATQIGDPAGQRVALVVGVIHGDERGGLRIVDAIRRSAPALPGTQLWVISSVNPDGMRARARKNAHAVDLNRNFPFRWRGGVPRSNGYYPGRRPASEPETREVMRFVEQIRPDVSIWYHQPWGAVLACPGPEAAAEYAKLVGMRTSCRGEGLRGTAISWEQHAVPGSVAFVVELRGGAISTATAVRHAQAAVTIAGGG